MYNKLKKILPKKVLVKNEPLLRKIIFQFYRGDKYACNICQQKFRTFILNQRSEKLCPSCGSMPRDRRLFATFEKEFPQKQSIKLLDFSPSRSLFRTFKSMKNVMYFSTDLSNDFIAEYKYDITFMPTTDNFFDAIICYHILEHIDDDAKAMSELFRVLKKGGKIFIQTPFKEGDIYENPEIKTDEERLKHFGQEDHVRVYSVNGLAERLRKTGFSVDVNVFDSDDYYGMSSNETVLQVSK